MMMPQQYNKESYFSPRLAKNASDIHFEPNDETFDIKMRIDGTLNLLSCN